uniref:Uncharacterized protein n=1 Tax=Anopheles atroparvus TaxID=41427 RepID=A0A182JKA3_ANOAO
LYLWNLVWRPSPTLRVIDVRVFSDQAPFEDKDFVEKQSDCIHATVLQSLYVNVSYGDQHRKSRINIVSIRDLPISKAKFAGTVIKHLIKYDWTAKFLFLLPSVPNKDIGHISSLAAALTFNRLFNNVFVVNERRIFTFNILLNALQRHDHVRAAIDHLYSDKFCQMHRYHLNEAIASETYPFHFVTYGRYSSFTREAFFLSMFVDRLNISMVDREVPLNSVDTRQLESILKENGIATAFGHTPGNFRRVFSNEMEVQFFILSPPTLRHVGRAETLLVFCYTIAIFNLVILYVSCVTSNLSTVRYRVGVKTVQDLIDQQIPILGHEPIMETLQMSRSNLNLNGSGTLLAVAHICSYLRLAEQHSPHLYHCIREPVLSHYIVYLLHQESILHEPLQKYVALSYQADLYRYWDNFIPTKVPMPKERPGLTAKVIAFEELIWQFVILPSGALLGAVVFVLELAWHNAQLRWGKKKSQPKRNSNVITL